MIAIMYDGLQLGTFYKDKDDITRLKLDDNIKRSWLPYIFDIYLDEDMDKVINVWKKERVFPKDRLGSKQMLKEIGLKKYDVDKIAEITRCSVITDPYWIAYEETDTYTKNSIRGQIDSEKYPYNSLKLTDEEKYTWRI